MSGGGPRGALGGTLGLWGCSSGCPKGRAGASEEGADLNVEIQKYWVNWIRAKKYIEFEQLELREAPKGLGLGSREGASKES